MKRSILEGKQILAVNDDPEALEVLGEKILRACPNCILDKITTYSQAVEMMANLTYDFVLLDIMGAHGFDLLNLAVLRNFPVAMLASHPLSPDALKRSIEMGARAYLPKEKQGEIVPFLEHMLARRDQPERKRFFETVKGFFASTFGTNSEPGIGSSWQEWASGGYRSNYH